MDQNTDLALQKIVEIQKSLVLEIEEHAGLSKKYTRGVKIVRITSDVLIASTALVGGIVGITLLLTVVEAPVVVIDETIALGIAGLIGTTGKSSY